MEVIKVFKTLKVVGISATVPNNCLPVDCLFDYMTKRHGGAGAVRDFAEWLLTERGEYEIALANYLKNRAT